MSKPNRKSRSGQHRARRVQGKEFKEAEEALSQSSVKSDVSGAESNGDSDNDSQKSGEISLQRLDKISEHMSVNSGVQKVNTDHKNNQEEIREYFTHFGLAWANVGESKLDKNLSPLVPFLASPNEDTIFEFFAHYPINFYTTFHCVEIPDQPVPEARDISSLSTYSEPLESWTTTQSAAVFLDMFKNQLTDKFSNELLTAVNAAQGNDRRLNNGVLLLALQHVSDCFSIDCKTHFLPTQRGTERHPMTQHNLHQMKRDECNFLSEDQLAKFWKHQLSNQGGAIFKDFLQKARDVWNIQERGDGTPCFGPDDAGELPCDLYNGVPMYQTPDISINDVRSACYDISKKDHACANSVQAICAMLGADSQAEMLERSIQNANGLCLQRLFTTRGEISEVPCVSYFCNSISQTTSIDMNHLNHMQLCTVVRTDAANKIDAVSGTVEQVPLLIWDLKDQKPVQGKRVVPAKVQQEFKIALVSCLQNLIAVIKADGMSKGTGRLEKQLAKQILPYQELWRLETRRRVYVDNLAILQSSKDGDFIKLLSLTKKRNKVDVNWKDKIPSVDGDLKFAERVKKASLFGINAPGAWMSDANPVPPGVGKDSPNLYKFLMSKPNDERKSYVRLYQVLSKGSRKYKDDELVRLVTTAKLERIQVFMPVFIPATAIKAEQESILDTRLFQRLFNGEMLRHIDLRDEQAQEILSFLFGVWTESQPQPEDQQGIYLLLEQAQFRAKRSWITNNVTRTLASHIRSVPAWRDKLGPSNAGDAHLAQDEKQDEPILENQEQAEWQLPNELSGTGQAAQVQQMSLQELIAPAALGVSVQTEINAVQDFLLQRVHSLEEGHALKELFVRKVQELASNMSIGVEVGFFREMRVLVKLDVDSLAIYTGGSTTWNSSVCALLMPNEKYTVMQIQSDAQQPVETNIPKDQEYCSRLVQRAALCLCAYLREKGMDLPMEEFIKDALTTTVLTNFLRGPCKLQVDRKLIDKYLIQDFQLIREWLFKEFEKKKITEDSQFFDLTSSNNSHLVRAMHQHAEGCGFELDFGNFKSTENKSQALAQLQSPAPKKVVSPPQMVVSEKNFGETLSSKENPWTFNNLQVQAQKIDPVQVQMEIVQELDQHFQEVKMQEFEEPTSPKELSVHGDQDAVMEEAEPVLDLEPNQEPELIQELSEQVQTVTETDPSELPTLTSSLAIKKPSPSKMKESYQARFTTYMIDHLQKLKEIAKKRDGKDIEKELNMYLDLMEQSAKLQAERQDENYSLAASAGSLSHLQPDAALLSSVAKPEVKKQVKNVNPQQPAKSEQNQTSANQMLNQQHKVDSTKEVDAVPQPKVAHPQVSRPAQSTGQATASVAVHASALSKPTSSLAQSILILGGKQQQPKNSAAVNASNQAIQSQRPVQPVESQRVAPVPAHVAPVKTESDHKARMRVMKEEQEKAAKAIRAKAAAILRDFDPERKK